MNQYRHHDNKSFKKLPNDAFNLLIELKASPRLIAHHILVHDVAWSLTDMLNKSFPKLHFNRNAVLYGAALHDIGKTVVPSELFISGSLHEEAGFKLLSEKGMNNGLLL